MNKKKLGAEHLKIKNRKLVFECIFNNPGISRPQIADLTKLSTATVCRIADELVELGVAGEYDSDEGNVGRRPALLHVCGENVPALAVELDRNRQICAVVDLTGKVHYRTERDFNVLDFSPEEICDIVLEMCNEAMTQPSMEGKHFIGLGIAMPGLVDIKSNTVILSAQFGWNNVPLGEFLEKAFPEMIIVLENDMNARALAESLFGGLRNEQNAVVLGIGSGVGAGIIIDGRVYRGSSSMAGEVGHIPMGGAGSGTMCECGSYGCLQTFLADRAILDDARRFKPDADIDTILEAANSNEQWATSIIDRFVLSATNAVSYVSSLLNPGAIVLTGSLLEDYPILRERLLKNRTLHSNGNLGASFRLLMSNLSRNCAVLGVGIHLYHKVYEEYI